jgi:hypothetical protein
MIAASAAAFIMILYRPGDEVLMPGGLLLGMAAGYSLHKHYAGFTGDGISGRTGAAKYLILPGRFTLGIAVTVLILAAFEKIIPENRFSDFYSLLYFIRFVSAGLWVSAGAPWLFRLLRLAGGSR